MLAKLRFNTHIRCCFGVNLYCFPEKKNLFSYNLVSIVGVFFQLLDLCTFFVPKSIKWDWNALVPMFWNLSVLALIRFDADTFWRKDSLALKCFGAIYCSRYTCQINQLCLCFPLCSQALGLHSFVYTKVFVANSLQL